MRVALRTFLRILNASIGKRTLILIPVAIISLAVIVVLVAVSFRNELTEDELIGALPILPPAGPIELQSARPLAASTAVPPAGDVETAMQSFEASPELVPSPRPRPVHKTRPRHAHNIRNIPDSALPILLAGSLEVQPVRPLTALMAAPHMGDAEGQDSVTSRGPGGLLPPAGPTEVQPVRSLTASTAASPAGDVETAVQSSGASRELVPSPPSRRVHKSRRAHNMRNRSKYSVPTLPPAGPMRPLPPSPAASPAGDAETAVQSSGAARELVPPPLSRRVHKSRRAHNMRNRSKYSVPTLPPAGPMRPLTASTAASPAGDVETAVQSSGASRELVPSPRPRPVHKPRPRPAHNIRNVPNNVGLTDAVAILKGLRDPSQIDRVVKDNPSNVFLLLMA